MKKPSLKQLSIFKPTGKWVIFLTVGAALATGIVALYSLPRSQPIQPTPALTPKANDSGIKVVAALGRLEPQGEVFELSAPTPVIGQGARVAQLLVKAGDPVKVGQVVAILDNCERNQAALVEAKRQVQVDQANLAKVKAGAKQGEIDAQKAIVARLKAQLQWEIVSQQATIARIKAQQQTQTQSQAAAVARIDAQRHNAETDAQRYQQLYQSGAISASEFDSRVLNVQTANKQMSEAEANLSQTIETMPQQLNEAKANLDKTVATLQHQIEEAESTLSQIEEVRPTDMQVAQAQVERSFAAVKQAQADLNLSYIRSPINGQVLKTHTKAGESVGNQGIVELGRTSQMLAVAEVNENNIGKVRLGQQAVITSDYSAFAGELHGKVIQIDPEIGKQDILDTDPAADIDARVVKVKILLAPKDNQRVANLTYAKVIVKISI